MDRLWFILFIYLEPVISEDVVFTDYHGDEYQEKDFMANYLIRYPEYKIHIDHLLQGGSGVAFIGQTSGSHIEPDIEVEEILIWTAEIEDARRKDNLYEHLIPSLDDRPDTHALDYIHKHVGCLSRQRTAA